MTTVNEHDSLVNMKSELIDSGVGAIGGNDNEIRRFKTFGHQRKYGAEAGTFNARDKGLGMGPKADRGCTDILCLMVFLASIGGMGFAGYYGWHHGDINRLTAPIDGDFRFCGSDAGVEDF